MSKQILRYKRKIEHQLYNNLLPFWEKLKDDKNGGFFGYVDSKGNIDFLANKGAMLQIRILWFFSSLYQIYPEERISDLAHHAFNFFKNKLIDEDGGIIWESDFKGNPIDKTKHIYYASFGLLAVSQYFKRFKVIEAEEIAHKLFLYIENNFKDEAGYIEQLDNNENRIADLSVKADRTMNSLLHLVEAYTEYTKVFNTDDSRLALKKAIDIFEIKIYNPKKQRLEVFFTHNMKSISDYNSFGHDIEAAWLLNDAAMQLNDKNYEQRILTLAYRLSKNIYEKGYKDGCLQIEIINGIPSKFKIWWVQAEAVLGFYKLGKSTHTKKFIEASYQILDNIFKNFIIPEIGEWYWKLSRDNQVDLAMPIVSNWKGPYHNGRMWIELLKEIASEEKDEKIS